MSKTVAQKMGVKEGMRAYFVEAPASVLDAIHLPSLDASRTLRGAFDYLHLFATSQAVMDTAFPKLVPHLKKTGMLWASNIKHQTSNIIHMCEYCAYFAGYQ